MNTALLLALFVAACNGLPAEINKQIVSGEETSQCEFPHMGFLLMNMPDGGMTACGGALISTTHILTAAHCINNIVGVTASFGHANHRHADQVIKGSAWTSHQSYGGEFSIVNDVGVIKLERPVKLGRCVKTIALPRPYQIFSGTCVAAGWGKMSNAQNGPDHMRKTVINVIPTKECQRNYYGIDKKQHVCVGDRTHMGRNICSGDSGSPLMCRSGNSWVIGGVASYVFDCDKGFGVYANVAEFIDWISSAKRSL